MTRLLSFVIALLFAVSAHAASTTAANAPARSGPASITSGTITGLSTPLPIASGGTAGATAQAATAALQTWFVPTGCSTSVGVSAPADTSADTLFTCTIPAGAIGPNGRVRVTMLVSFTNNGNSKTIRSSFGGAGYMAIAFTSVGSLQYQYVFGNRNSASSQVGSNTANSGVFGSTSGAAVTSSIDTTALQNLIISCQKATASDACTLESAVVEVLYGA